MSGGGAKKSVVGYRYYRSMSLAICHGPIDALREIWIKDKVAWRGDLRRNADNDNTKTGRSSQDGLFGGESLEGGVGGFFEVAFGGFNQWLMGVNADGTTTTAPHTALGVKFPYMPAKGTNYRGIAMVNFFDFYWGTNPYISDIAFNIEVYWDGWYPERNKIGVNANPAHIIYECLVNGEWGLGYDREIIDDDSFRVAAATLYDEGLGLSLSWSETSTIEEFIDSINDQIDATFFYNQKNEKWSLRLIRASDPVVMPIGPGDCRLTTFSRRMYGETVNELTVRWVNPATEEYQALTIHDGGNIEATEQIIPGSKDYPGVRSEVIAARLGQRDLRALSSTLASAEIVANRTAWRLNPGDIILFTWPDLDVISVRMRVTQTTQLQNKSDITITLVEDVFGQAQAVFNGEQPTDWVDTRTQPTQFEYLTPFELPFWYVFQALSGVIPEVEVTYGTVLAGTTNVGIQSARLFAEQILPSTTQYGLVDTANSTPVAMLSADLPRSWQNSASVFINTVTNITRIETDSFAVIGGGVDGEIVRVVQNIGNGTFVLQRGLMDTHPKAWPAGTSVWFIGKEQFPVDPTARSMAETVNYKMTMQTSLGTTEIDDVPATPVYLEGRQGRPYPVANVRVEGQYWPSYLEVTDGFLRIDFSTRNRLLQNADAQVLWNEGSVVTEANTQVLVFLTQAGVVVASALLPDPSVGFIELPVAGVPTGATRLVIRTIRDGLDNYQDFTHDMTLSLELLSGWGADWSTDWGD
jgi:hypothetical protein